MTEGKDFVEQRTWRTEFLSIFTGMLLKKTWLAYTWMMVSQSWRNRSWLQVYSWRSYACLWTRYAHDHSTWSFGPRCFKYSLKNNMLFLFQPSRRKWSWWYAYIWRWCLGDWLPDEVYRSPRPSRFQGRWYCDNTSTLFAGTCESSLLSRGRVDMRLSTWGQWCPSSSLTLLLRCKRLSVVMLTLSRVG